MDETQLKGERLDEKLTFVCVLAVTAYHLETGHGGTFEVPKLSTRAPNGSRSKNRHYACPHPGCHREYTSWNGLMYHLKKGKNSGHGSASPLLLQGDSLHRDVNHTDDNDDGDVFMDGMTGTTNATVIPASGTPLSPLLLPQSAVSMQRNMSTASAMSDDRVAAGDILANLRVGSTMASSSLSVASAMQFSSAVASSPASGSNSHVQDTAHSAMRMPNTPEISEPDAVDMLRSDSSTDIAGILASVATAGSFGTPVHESSSIDAFITQAKATTEAQPQTDHTAIDIILLSNSNVSGQQHDLQPSYQVNKSEDTVDSAVVTAFAASQIELAMTGDQSDIDGEMIIDELPALAIHWAKEGDHDVSTGSTNADAAHEDQDDGEDGEDGEDDDAGIDQNSQFAAGRVPLTGHSGLARRMMEI
eukprot:jgi/Hompol1/6958/HPOL_001012-RA